MRKRELVATADAPSSGRSTVTVSYAQTVDGRIAAPNGSSRWISTPESLRFAHELRAGHDAVMVGVGTVVKDDPRLTVRLVPGADPRRIVVDSTLRTPDSAAVLAGGAARGTVLAVNGRAPMDRCREAEALGAVVLRLPSTPEGGVDLAALVSRLPELGVRSVMVEGGASIITALLCEKLVDRLAVCIAPKILGSGVEAVGDLGICDLADSITLEDAAFSTIGGDVILDGRVGYPTGRDVESRAG